MYEFQTDSTTSEMLIAFLAELPFDTFEEDKNVLKAYIPLSEHNSNIEKEVTALQSLFQFDFNIKNIPYQNWNKIWESNFEPITVGNFCAIRADFHPQFPNFNHQITINPEMAFGTGHHATTFMMIELMKNIDFSNKKVLDYGCGTGILAILAAKMGSKDIDAVDIEKPAYFNTIENNKINDVHQNINTYCGTLENIPKENTYDIILANINRNVILATLDIIYEKLNRGGTILFSGFLKNDTNTLKEALSKKGFYIGSAKNKEKWIALKAYKRY